MKMLTPLRLKEESIETVALFSIFFSNPQVHFWASTNSIHTYYILGLSKFQDVNSWMQNMKQRKFIPSVQPSLGSHVITALVFGLFPCLPKDASPDA